MDQFEKDITLYLDYCFHTTAEKATLNQLYSAVSAAALKQLMPRWDQGKDAPKRVCYFSAEFLTGRLIYSNLQNQGLLEKCKSYLAVHSIDISVFEDIEDNALGNGGLGRLAACFLDSAATHGIALDGYGIRYRYGLFRQSIENGFQKEEPDDWQRFGDPWSVRKEIDSVVVRFGDQAVLAVPYDMPIIGWGGETANTLRLWQSEPLQGFDFKAFNDQDYGLAMQDRDMAESISAVLYPNDNTPAGKKLRLKQQYFFVSASLQSILKRFIAAKGTDFTKFPEAFPIQLNDTHPVVAIPEFLRLLMSEHGLEFEPAFDIIRKTFAYTNHTVMTEALEKWDIELFRETLPHVFPYVEQINDALFRELSAMGADDETKCSCAILDGTVIHMARLAVYSSHSVNGVAKLHTEILKNDVFSRWYQLYPQKFNNKTNGITQRRWLKLCNPQLSGLITEKIGDGWIRDLGQLSKLKEKEPDLADLERFMAVKTEKKRELSAYVQKREGVGLDPGMIFDVQIKRLHEYKRQLLNALSILDTYFGIKDGRIQDFYPTAYIFGAKAAPGYHRAKGIIKLICEIGRKINNDPETSRLMQVLFVQNYDVSYAEKLIPAADISQQISPAGTEASGTGNMKLMLSGAVTMGTMDGANIEIVEQAGLENNYIFGATLEEIRHIEGAYNPKMLYDENPRIRRVVDALTDGNLDDGGTGMFADLYNCLLYPSYNRADNYFVLYDFPGYCETRQRANHDYRDRFAFARKGWINMASAGKFSSDRTIKEYAGEIWGFRNL